jgi:hypothetical protein
MAASGTARPMAAMFDAITSARRIRWSRCCRNGFLKSTPMKRADCVQSLHDQAERRRFRARVPLPFNTPTTSCPGGISPPECNGPY